MIKFVIKIVLICCLLFGVLGWDERVDSRCDVVGYDGMGSIYVQNKYSNHDLPYHV